MGVEGELAVEGEELEEVVAGEEDFFVFDGESFGDGIKGMFGPVS